MRSLRGHRWAAGAGTALLLVLALAAPADARKFQMSGTWLVRRGQTFVPLQFAKSGGPATTQVSMGLFTEASFSPPGQVLSAVGAVTATGASPARLRLPKHAWLRSHDLTLPLFGSKLVQITTMLEIDAPHEAATLEAGGGAGSFTWCPGNPACAAGGLPPGFPPGTGRIVYVAGSNRFGGTMQMGLRGGGLVSLKNFAGGFVGRILHVPFLASGSAPWRLAVGGGANDAAHAEMHSLAPALVTQPTMFPASGSPILYPGPFVTTMLGNTATMPSGMKFAFPTLGMGAGQLTTSWGFPHTTGTVLVQQTTGSGGGELFTVMGSDARTPLGAGNLSTVAGGLTRLKTLGGDSGYADFDRVSMTFGPPVPSLSPGGFAAAFALLLLAAGYALRRRRA